jgi:hypothetical protein
LVACDGHQSRSCATPGSTPKLDCPGGEQRNAMCCDQEFRLDATNVKGDVKTPWGGAGLASETKAVREINDSIMGYAFKAKRLCDAWNACAINQNDYIVQSKDMQRALDGLAPMREKFEEALAASDPRSRAKLLGDAYAVVPPEQRTEVSMAFWADVELPLELSKVPAKPCEKDTVRTYERGAGHPLPLGDTLPSGARVSFRIETSRDAHVYLFQRKPDGSIDVLFPQKAIQTGNPLKGNQTQRIPTTGGYCVDENGIGVETVYIVASLQPIAQLGATLDKIDSGAAARTAAAPPPPAQSSSCRTRDLKLEGDSPAPATCDVDRGVRTRDLKFIEDDGPSAPPPSMSASSEAADDVVIKEFKFEHVAPDAYAKLKAGGSTKSRGIVVEY